MTSKTTSTAGDRLPPGGMGSRLWRIRTEKGDTFGPADLPTLRAWAKDGRLAPTHQISDDDHAWIAVTSLSELEMDWVAEVTSGSFYGPIHRDAMAELVRDGSVRAAAPQFQRINPAARPAATERELQLEQRVRELQQKLSSRVAELESHLTAARGELEQNRSVLGAKDLEFDAERQEQKASVARLQAELLKRDGRISALESDVQRLEQLARDRQTLEARMAEAERLTAEHTRQTEQACEQLEQARTLQREAERSAAQLQERISRHDRDTEALRETARTLKLRLESVRKLLQQAGTVAGGADTATDAEIVEPAPAAPTAAGSAQEGPPPLATPRSGMKPGMSLADLEAQAQRELRQLGSTGGALFKGRSKN